MGEQDQASSNATGQPDGNTIPVYDPAAAGIEASLQPVGGTHHVFTRVMPRSAIERFEPVLLRMSVSSTNGRAQRIGVTMTATDIFGQSVPWRKDMMINVPADGATMKRTVGLDAGTGYFLVTAVFHTETGTLMRSTDVGILPPNHAGIRENSFFAVTAPTLRRGDDLNLLQLLGIKVLRTHLQPIVRGLAADRGLPGPSLLLDFRDSDADLYAAIGHEITVLPIVGHAFLRDGQLLRDELAHALESVGPPRDIAEFIATWSIILKRYRHLQTVEFWDHPRIFGQTWAATPESFRQFLHAWCAMALEQFPQYRILAGCDATFAEDNLLPAPESWEGMLSGLCHHLPPFSIRAPHWRAGDLGRAIDAGLLMTRRMELSWYYMAQGGTEYTAPSTWDGHPGNNLENAGKLIQSLVRGALNGAYQGNVPWTSGIGPGWTKGNTVLGVLAHLTEDRPVLTEIWPEHELLWGAIFAHPRHITDDVWELPRAEELSSRWGVAIPEVQDGDHLMVAVVWGLTGLSNTQLDEYGTLTLPHQASIRSYDMVGRVIPPTGEQLIIPFSRYPVYLVTDSLSVVEMRRLIAGATIEGITPVNLYPLSLPRPANETQMLGVRIENQMNCPVQGTLELAMAGQPVATVPVTLPAAKLVEVAVPWPGVPIQPENRYAVTLSITVDALDGPTPRPLPAVTKAQTIQVARFMKRHIAGGDSLAGWQGVTPVTLRDATTECDARIYTAYDDTNVYITAAIREKVFHNSAGEPWHEGLPYRRGVPDGLEHVTHCGNALLLSFGFRDRVPGYGRQLDDPYAWKGHFYDTDYHYVAHPSTDGPQLIRQWGADTPRRTAYQLEDVPYVGPVDGARVAITRDDAAELTIYEIAISRTELTLFDPAAGRCRFGVVICNDEVLGTQGLQWSEEAGVFDHWYATGSFSPPEISRLPCQTFFGIEP